MEKEMVRSGDEQTWIWRWINQTLGGSATLDAGVDTVLALGEVAAELSATAFSVESMNMIISAVMGRWRWGWGWGWRMG